MPEDDPRAVAAAISTILDDPDQARVLAVAAQRRASTLFSRDASAQAFAATFTALCEARRTK